MGGAKDDPEGLGSLDLAGLSDALDEAGPSADDAGPSATERALREGADDPGLEEALLPHSTRDLLDGALGEDDEPEALRPLSLRAYTFLTDGAPSGAERRRAHRFDYAIPATLRDTERRSFPCTATSGSIDGLFLETDQELAPGTAVQLEIRLFGGHSRHLDAQVVRASGKGVGIQFSPDHATLGFRGAFLELARQPILQRPALVVHLRTSEVEPGPPERSVEELWDEVIQAPDRDELHQSFIHAAMRQDRLDYAVDRYRTRLRSGDAEARGYLDQLGVIISFYQKPSAGEDDPGTDPRRYRLWGAALALFVLSVIGARWLLGAAAPRTPTFADFEQGTAPFEAAAEPPREAPMFFEPEEDDLDDPFRNARKVLYAPGDQHHLTPGRGSLLEPIPLED